LPRGDLLEFCPPIFLDKFQFLNILAKNSQNKGLEIGITPKPRACLRAGTDNLTARARYSKSAVTLKKSHTIDRGQNEDVPL
jgi:hypothetical protein